MHWRLTALDISTPEHILSVGVKLSLMHWQLCDAIEDLIHVWLNCEINMTERNMVFEQNST